MHNVSESLLQYRKSAEACYMLLQAKIYDSDELSSDAHPILEALLGASKDGDEFNVICDLIMHMLCPDVTERATVEQALGSELFAGV